MIQIHFGKKNLKIIPTRLLSYRPRCPASVTRKNIIFSKSLGKLGNVFEVGPNTCFGRSVSFYRIDEHYRYVFDVEKFKAATSKAGNKSVKEPDIAQINAIEKQRIHNEIGIALFCEDALSQTQAGAAFRESGIGTNLPTPEKIQSTIDRFKSNIKRRLPDCKLNINKSIRAAELCYCTLLMEDSQHRTDAGTRFEFDLPERKNVFGDMHIVQSAIYLGAKIITKDKLLEKMAGYAEIECCHVPHGFGVAGGGGV